jgi:ribonuclease I
MPEMMRNKTLGSALTSLIFSAALAITGAGSVAARDLGPRAPGSFDYYVLALSWEPGFCATTTGHADECRAPRVSSSTACGRRWRAATIPATAAGRV